MTPAHAPGGTAADDLHRRLGMAATGAREVLDRLACERIVAFLAASLAPGGGYRDRTGAADLYYTQFGLSAGLALGGVPDAATAGYVAGFGDGEGLDYVHLAALVRCRKMLLENNMDGGDEGKAGVRMAAFRARGGGCSRPHGAAAGAAYDTFLAVLSGAPAETANFAMPAPDAPTPVLAAALALQAMVGDAAGGAVLLAALRSRSLPGGGFLAVPGSPVPDLLSAAVALFALRTAGVRAEGSAGHLAFVTSLWNDDGGFSGTPDDVVSDCEYTFYALLALGCLAGEVA